MEIRVENRNRVIATDNLNFFCSHFISNSLNVINEILFCRDQFSNVQTLQTVKMKCFKLFIKTPMFGAKINIKAHIGDLTLFLVILSIF